MRCLVAVVALFGVWGVVCPGAFNLAASPAQTRIPGQRVAQKQANRMPKAIPSPQFQRFQQMSPEERERALSKLPPDRRARIEQQLRRYESLTPAQKDFVNRRLEMLRSLPPQRQAAVRQELQRLRGLHPAQRKSALNSEEERE
jgi:hypothetical protein